MDAPRTLGRLLNYFHKQLKSSPIKIPLQIRIYQAR